MKECAPNERAENKLTICLALICENRKSVVAVADRMVSVEFLSLKFEQHTRKIDQIGRSFAALTSGDALGHTDIIREATEAISKMSLPSVLEVAAELVHVPCRIVLADQGLPLPLQTWLDLWAYHTPAPPHPVDSTAPVIIPIARAGCHRHRQGSKWTGPSESLFSTPVHRAWAPTRRYFRGSWPNSARPAPTAPFDKTPRTGPPPAFLRGGAGMGGGSGHEALS